MNPLEFIILVSHGQPGIARVNEKYCQTFMLRVSTLNVEHRIHFQGNQVQFSGGTTESEVQ